MKSKKKKLMYMVTTLALTMSFLLVGVYSAANRQATISGSLSFTSSFVWVSYSIHTSDPFVSGGSPATWNATGLTGKFDETQTSQTQSLSDHLEVTEALKAIAIRITFTRDSFNKTYYLKVTASAATENSMFKSVDGTGNFTSTTGDQVVTIIFTIKDNHSYKAVTSEEFEIGVELSLEAFT